MPDGGGGRRRAREAEAARDRRSRMWPSAAGSRRELPTSGELLGWGVFSTTLAVVLTVTVGAGTGRALALGGLGLAATAALWAAARFGGDAPRGRSPGGTPTGA